LVLAAAILILWVLRRAGPSLTPFIIGLILAYLLLPLVHRLDRYIPRWAAILIVYALGLGVLGLGVNYIVPPVVNQVSQFVNNLPDVFQRAEQEFNQRVADVQNQLSEDVRQQVEEQITTVQETIRNNATTYAQRAGTFLFTGVITLFQTLAFIIGFLVIPFFLFYVLVDVDRLPNTVNQMLHPRIRADFWNIWGIVDGTLGRYIRGQLLLGLIIGVAVFLGLTGLNLAGFDIPFTGLLAIVAGIGELIPVVGPILSAIPAVLVAFRGGPTAVLAVIALFVIIQQLENQVLVPRIVGNTLRLHPALLMALLVIAAAVGGLLLVIVSAPLAAIGRDVFVYLHRRLREPPLSPALAIEGLMGDEEPEPEDAAEKQLDDQAVKRPTHTAT
jgi:predicted PurR-regulated permease PerM